MLTRHRYSNMLFDHSEALEAPVVDTRPSTTRQAGDVGRAYLEALGAQDLDRACALWSRDGVDDLVGIAMLHNPDEVRDFFADIYAALTGFSLEILSITAQDDRAVAHWRMRGRFDGSGTMLGLAPNGRALDMRGVDLLTVHNGLIVHNTSFTNAAEMARQLAVLPPQGSKLERVMYGVANATAPIGKAIRRRRSQHR